MNSIRVYMSIPPPPINLPHGRYRILDAPVGYAPIRTPSRRLLATPTPMPMTPGFKMMQTPAREEYGVPATPTESSLPFIKPEDYQVRHIIFVSVD